MCGVYGIWSSKSNPLELRERLQAMGDQLFHRGPDNRAERFFQGVWGSVGIGFTRLAILDVHGENPPLVSPEDGVTIAVNGQIYNYLELKSEMKGQRFITKGDIETAMHLYRRRGKDFLNSLNGMFAGVIFDPLKESLLLFRDRFGIKPLYYSFENDELVFASEIRALAAGKKTKPELNREMLPSFFTYRHVPGEDTLFQDIHRITPASFLEIDLRSGKTTKGRYWNYLEHAEKSGKLDESEASELFLELFKDAVKIRLRSDVEVGCLLSGGMDSSAVASIAAMNNPSVKLFTISLDGEDYDESGDVSDFLNNRPDLFNAVHHVMAHCSTNTLGSLPGIIESVEEPLGLAAMIPTNEVCSLASKHVKTVLTGEGADEIFCGYRKFSVECAALRYTKAKADERKHLETLYPELHGCISSLNHPPERRYASSEMLFNDLQLERLLGSPSIGPPSLPVSALPVFPKGDFEPLDLSVAMELNTRLPDYVALRLDKISMRHSLETRTPFLDYRLAQLAARIPAGSKVDLNAGQGKQICRKALSSASILDFTTAARRKKPFTMNIAGALCFLLKNRFSGRNGDTLNKSGMHIECRSSRKTAQPDELLSLVFGAGDPATGLVHKQGILDPEFVLELTTRVAAEGVTPETLVSDADRVFAILVFTLWHEEFL